MPIYVVGHQPVTGPVKIGYSASAQGRLAQLRSGASCPVEVAALFGIGLGFSDLAILLTVEGTFKLESALHKSFADARVAGEWFVIGETPDAVRLVVLQHLEHLAAMESRPKLRYKPKIKPTNMCARCFRICWPGSTMCKAHDLDAWLRQA